MIAKCYCLFFRIIFLSWCDLHLLPTLLSHDPGHWGVHDKFHPGGDLMVCILDVSCGHVPPQTGTWDRCGLHSGNLQPCHCGVVWCKRSGLCACIITVVTVLLALHPHPSAGAWSGLCHLHSHTQQTGYSQRHRHGHYWQGNSWTG